jgi:hypothetical protein
VQRIDVHRDKNILGHWQGIKRRARQTRELK